MQALQQIADLLINTFFSLYLLALLLRLLLQLARADFYNPISQFLVKITQPVIAPLRRLLPSIGPIDTATVLVVLLLQVLATALLITVKGIALPHLLALLIWATIGTVSMVLNIYFFALIASIILSWVAPGNYNPAILLLNQLTEPVMKPFRKLIPPMGGLDISPIFVFLVINVLRIIIQNVAVAAQTPFQFVLGI